jgi:glutathione S-transferase
MVAIPFSERCAFVQGSRRSSRIESKGKLDDSLSRLEHQLEGREYLVGQYTLADIAHAGNFHRLRVLAKSGEVPLQEYPNVMAWMERVESRESYKVSV